MRLTFCGHHSGTKIAEEETGSIAHSSTAATGVPHMSRAWSGPQQSYSRGARQLEGKLSNRNTSSTIWASTQRPDWKVCNYSDDRWINPQRWEETSTKRRKTPENKTSHLLQKKPKLLTSKGTKQDGEWLWQNDIIRLQKVGNEKFPWAKKNMF